MGASRMFAHAGGGSFTETLLLADASRRFGQNFDGETYTYTLTDMCIYIYIYKSTEYPAKCMVRCIVR